MEIPPHCTVSDHRRRTDVLGLALLTLAVLLVHGFHPRAEDGGLYLAGVELLLQPSLFPLDRPFVTAPSHYSLFAPAVAGLVRLSHAPLDDVLLGLYLFTTMLLLYAALCLSRRCFPSQPGAQWAGVALLAAWWTLPVAGTSLLLMDPYLTARSFSTPLTLLALHQILSLPGHHNRTQQPQRAHQRPDPFCILRGPAGRSVLCCLILLAATAAVHLLMALYAALFTLTLALVTRRAPLRFFILLGLSWIGIMGAWQAFAQPEPFAVQLAVQSRYYWFLSNWRWFECLGLAGPLAVLFGILKWSTRHSTSPFPSAIVALCRGSLFVGLLSILVSIFFVQEHFAAHSASRLQPLRSFLPIYALLPLLLGGILGSLATRRLWRTALPWSLILCSAGTMFVVQRATFPASPHIEWPGRAPTNRWTQAFIWARQHTPRDARFALDALYINTPGEDAQSFRAWAQRSSVPDFSKDGGEAANFPALAPAWLSGATATANLSQLSDAQRTGRLNGLGVSWLILQGTAKTTLLCPYQNQTVKVCHR